MRGAVKTLSGKRHQVVKFYHLVSLCHLVPPEDTKWQKLSLSGKDPK